MIDPIQNQSPPAGAAGAAGAAGPESAGPCSKSDPAKVVQSPFAKTLGRVKNEETREEIFSAVMESSAKYNLPPEVVFAVIRQESGGNPNATSSCGASGVMQLMPETARNLGVRDRHDIRQNIEGGCKYLRELSDRYHGDLKLTLAAYNAGPGNVDKYGGVPPFEETKNYVASIQSHLKELRESPNLRAAGLEAIAQLDFSFLPNLLKTGPDRKEGVPPEGLTRRLRV